LSRGEPHAIRGDCGHGTEFSRDEGLVFVRELEGASETEGARQGVRNDVAKSYRAARELPDVKLGVGS